ncbi:threonine-phosphate decarboxylase CobD [Paenibacillus sp. 1P07SE]|uniref:threonine-phosphate decarboxylase CobD n=1 Tax=Paenibacillus sp. 1P07SE TaxID=3132209 RepID=UPI0039A609CF
MNKLEQYGHGGDLRTASEAYGYAPEAFLDYSSNMNPFGPPAAVRAVIGAYAQQIHCYPDPAVRELRRRLALHHGIGEEHILVGNGAAELIDLAVRWLRPATTGLAVPCFAEYGDAVRKSGSTAQHLSLLESEGFRLDTVRLEASGLRPDLWLLGAPNNPTGQLLDRSVIRGLLERGDQLILDEAFMDFVPAAADYSWVREAAGSDQLLVIRSMTKFYAIPGIRLGYIVGSPSRIGALRELQVPWSVNSLAERIGCAVLADEAYARRTLQWLAEERPWFTAGLQALGFRVYDSAANYVLVRMPEAWRLQVSQLQDTLGRQGVLIRNASTYVGLKEGYFRLAVRLREENERLLRHLAEAIHKLAERSEEG